MLTVKQMTELLNAETARAFRITHRDNFEWLVRNGIHCRSSGQTDPNFVPIGNADIIEKRKARLVAVPPGGTLSDYVPFYFTPFSPMARNINTGFNGIRKWPNKCIIIAVTTVFTLVEKAVPFLVADRNAVLAASQFSSDPEHLTSVDWRSLQARDFKRDNDDLEKFEKYMAELLVHKLCPVSALTGIACYNEETATDLRKIALGCEVDVKVAAKPEWYF